MANVSEYGPTEIGIVKIHPDAIIPTKGTRGAAGWDVHACIPAPVVMMPGERHLIPTGLGCRLPKDWEIQVRPRSGMAIKHGIMILNSPGTIDSDYQGEIMIGLLNTNKETPYVIEPGHRIAQLVPAYVEPVVMKEVAASETPTERATGGFGSTGK